MSKPPLNYFIIGYFIVVLTPVLLISLIIGFVILEHFFVPSFQKIDVQVQQTIIKAVQSKNPELCNNLPKVREYNAGNDKGTVVRGQYFMKEECLKKYYQTITNS